MQNRHYRFYFVVFITALLFRPACQLKKSLTFTLPTMPTGAGPVTKLAMELHKERMAQAVTARAKLGK
jgi:hypothetical protein